MNLLKICTKYLCLEVSEDISSLILKPVNGGEGIAIDVDGVDEVVEVLEEIAELAKMFAQYIKELKYVKGVDIGFSATDIDIDY